MAAGYVEHDSQRTDSTLRDYRNTVRRSLLPYFGADTPVARITTDDIAVIEPRRWSLRPYCRRGRLASRQAPTRALCSP